MKKIAILRQRCVHSLLMLVITRVLINLNTQNFFTQFIYLILSLLIGLHGGDTFCTTVLDVLPSNETTSGDFQTHFWGYKTI